VKLLYVNGSFEGGSILSTRQLLERLPTETIDWQLLRASPQSPLAGYLRRRMTNLAVKLGGDEPDNIVEAANRMWGRSPVPISGNESSSVAVENATRTVLADWQPDVVVVSSVERVPWRRIRRAALAAGTPCVLYLREEALLPHLELTTPPDLLLANSRGLVDRCRDLGYEARLVPSVVDLATSTVESTRRAALLINPTASYGLDRAIELAETFPEVPFVLQESVQLSPDQRASVHLLCSRLANVEFREFSPDPAHVYRDAKVLLAPYTDFLESNRPRSVLEAQANGIPVLGSARAGLRDAVGTGGTLLSVDATSAEWAHAFQQIWSAERYRELVAAARDHAGRDEVQPATIVDSFVAAIATVGSSNGLPGRG